MDLSTWLEAKTQTWHDAIVELSRVSIAYPQSAYAAFQKSLQAEWQFVQRVVQDIGPVFSGIEEAITTKFLPSLFGSNPLPTSPTLRHILALPVKCAGIAIPNPVVTAAANYQASTVLCSHLLSALRGATPFCSADHKTTIHMTRSELQVRNSAAHASVLRQQLATLPPALQRIIGRGTSTGHWLSVLPSLVNGTDLSALEFRDALSLRYGLKPATLPSTCDGCGARFSVQHALECASGGLVIMRHNELRDELSALASRALKPSAVRDEPIITPSSSPSASGSSSASQAPAPVVTSPDDRGDLLIRNLWSRGTDCIIDVRVTDLDAKSQNRKAPSTILANHEKAKKHKYLAACLQQRCHFVPFVVSTDGLLGREANFLIKKLAALLSEKWSTPYSTVCGFIRARISIAIVRATHLCLRGSRIPSSQISQPSRLPLWEDQAGLRLFTH